MAKDLKLLDSEGRTVTSPPGQETLRKPPFPYSVLILLTEARFTWGEIMEKSMKVEVEGLGVGPSFVSLLVRANPEVTEFWLL